MTQQPGLRSSSARAAASKASCTPAPVRAEVSM